MTPRTVLTSVAALLVLLTAPAADARDPLKDAGIEVQVEVGVEVDPGDIRECIEGHFMGSPKDGIGFLDPDIHSDSGETTIGVGFWGVDSSITFYDSYYGVTSTC